MASTWDEKDERATSSSDYNSKMEEYFNFFMANIDITK